MTTVSFNLDEHEIAALTAKAAGQGLTLEAWLRKMAAPEAAYASVVNLQKTNSQEWARQFDAWVDSHDPNLPVLSDEAMSRDSIYPDRD